MATYTADGEYVSIWSQTDEELAAAKGMTLPEFRRWQEIQCRPAIRLDTDKDNRRKRDPFWNMDVEGRNEQDV